MSRPLSSWPAGWPRWGLSFLAVALPLVPFRYLVLPAGVPAPLASGMQHLPTAVCLLLGAGWLWHHRRTLRTTLGQAPLGWPVLAMLLSGLLSSAGAAQPAASLARTGYYFATGGLVYLVLTDRERPVRPLLTALLVAAYAVAGYGIVEYVTGAHGIFSASFDPTSPEYRRFAPDPWFERRVMSTLGHPVALGVYLVLVLPVSLAAAMAATGRRMRLLLGLGTALILLALVLTFSRGAWVAAVVAAGVYLSLRGRRYLLALPLTLALVAGAALSVAGVSELARERVRDAYVSYVLNFSATTRGAAYAYGAVIADRQPLTGLGAGMYRYAAYDLRRELPIPTPLGVLDTPDNGYLMALAEGGAVGLLVLLFVLTSLGRLLWPAARAPTGGDRGELARGFLAALAGFAVCLLTVDALHLPVSRTIFWLIAGLGVTTVTRDASGQAP